MEYKRVAMDTSKHVFTVHCVDVEERCVLRRDLRRNQVEGFFGKLAPTEVALEACGASHHWGRVLEELGHRARLIPPQYVRPFVKRGKSNRLDADAISAAASRPDMRFVPVKTAERQADAMLLRVRELLVKQRSALVNALRGHAAEFGVAVAKGLSQVAALLEAVAGSAMPEAGQRAIAVLAEQLGQLDETIGELDGELRAQHTANPLSRRLAAVPGIGPVTALSLALTVDAERFASGRHFAASLGLTPKQHSTGERQQLGKISRAGDERLRRLLVIGAMSVIRFAKPGRKGVSAWLLGLLERKPRKLVAVALANKMARVVWAMMARGEAYRPMPSV
jgi:transposase